MPNGYIFSCPKVKRFQDENDKSLYEYSVNVMDLRTGQVVAECSAVVADEVNAKRLAVDQANAFMHKDRGTVQS